MHDVFSSQVGLLFALSCFPPTTDTLSDAAAEAVE
jgi:hypothetical protein